MPKAKHGAILFYIYNASVIIRNMAKTNDEIKKEFDEGMSQLTEKRKIIDKKYKEIIRDKKIEEIKKQILDL